MKAYSGNGAEEGEGGGERAPGGELGRGLSSARHRQVVWRTSIVLDWPAVDRFVSIFRL